MGKFGMPLEKPMDMMTAGDGIKYMVKNMGAFMKVSKYNKMTMEELAGKFKNQLLCRALLAWFPKNCPSIALMSTLGGMNDGDCGYPVGGSLAIAKRMEKRFTGLGGKVFYKTRVNKVLVDKGRAVGIKLADGKEILGDHVVSCACLSTSPACCPASIIS